MRALRGVVAGVLLVMGAGCYRYSAAPPESVAPGTAVRARLTAAEAERVGEVLGREDRVLSGSLVESGGSGILLEVSSGSAQAGLQPQPLRQRLSVPRSGLVELEVRRLDPWRTAAVVAAAGTVIGFVVVSAFDTGDSSPTGERPGGENARIPILRIPIR